MPLVRTVSIENYKSIRKLDLELGRVNVLIGANGSGKSNLLEAIALGSAVARGKLDHEYLVPRGIRVVEPRFMRAAFPGSDADRSVAITLHQEGGGSLRYVIDPELRFKDDRRPTQVQLGSGEFFDTVLARYKSGDQSDEQQVVHRELMDLLRLSWAPDFLIYAPENSALRIFQTEAQILPLGVKGEGLFAHLKALAGPEHTDRLAAIGERLALLDWFERLEIPKDLAPGERSILIRDRYLAEGALFDQRSANEGFLFLLFYLTLFISHATPSFFAIDNVETSLNPKLVKTLVAQLVELARAHDKQVIFTTHNPAVLDGIDLRDDEQRLFVTERAKDGATRARRVSAPQPVEGDAPVALSEAFVRGYLGGLPKNF